TPGPVRLNTAVGSALNTMECTLCSARINAASKQSLDTSNPTQWPRFFARVVVGFMVYSLPRLNGLLTCLAAYGLEPKIASGLRANRTDRRRGSSSLRALHRAPGSTHLRLLSHLLTKPGKKRNGEQRRHTLIHISTAANKRKRTKKKITTTTTFNA